MGLLGLKWIAVGTCFFWRGPWKDHFLASLATTLPRASSSVFRTLRQCAILTHLPSSGISWRVSENPGSFTSFQVSRVIFICNLSPFRYGLFWGSGQGQFGVTILRTCNECFILIAFFCINLFIFKRMGREGAKDHGILQLCPSAH